MHPATARSRVSLGGLGRATVLAFALAGSTVAHASPASEAALMDAPAPGLLEVGAPLFTIQGHEALGLNIPPSDLKLLPDGRILVVGGQEIAMGDGVRWEVFRQSASETPRYLRNVAIDEHGRLYATVAAGFARIDFGSSGAWSYRLVQPWIVAHGAAGAVPRAVLNTGTDWFWHNDSGVVLTWKPDEPVRVRARANSVEHLFRLKDHTYLSDRTTGELWRIDGEEPQRVAILSSISPSETITCSAAFDTTRALVGTYRRGLALFDGDTLQPFVSDGLLSSDVKVNDVCAVEGGFYAAAIENHGIVFFDRRGRVVQVLDRRYDHRLSKVLKLVASPGGLVWGMLPDAIVQVEFPSRLSYFEPLIGSGINIALPARFDGRLWLMADGYIYRSTYDRFGRLSGLQIDTPPGAFAANPDSALGFLSVSTADAAYRRIESGWEKYFGDIRHLMLLRRPPHDGRHLYAGVGELGWIKSHGGRVTTERIPVPDLPRLYGSETDAALNTWLELGQGQTGRLRVIDGHPRVELFDHENGIPPNWVQVFKLDGEVRFNIADRVYGFDEHTRRFVIDETFIHRFPGLRDVIGRPGKDAHGRIWLTSSDGVQVFQQDGSALRNLGERMPPGFLPYYFTFQRDGVVWMHGWGRLARYDPAMPAPAQTGLRALLTRVVVGTQQQQRMLSSSDMGELPFAENSLVFHFCAPNSAFKTVTFDVKLEGSEQGEWIPSGSAGSAAFNHLREGSYALRVRPRSGNVQGLDALVRFTILPPWYRTQLAYAGYLLAGLVLIGLVGRLVLYVQRRENARLESLVAQRTRELNASTERLAAQLDENRVLSAAMQQSPTAVFITDPRGLIIFANPRACELAGCTFSDLARRNIQEIRAPTVASEVLTGLAETIGRGETWHGELANRRQDGAVIQVRSIVAPIRNAQGQILHHLILEEDITEALNEQQHRQRLEAQLFQSQKMESIGTLAGGIAHDFNNILTAILGYCELAELDSADNPQVQRDLAGVQAAGTRAKDLVARILTFSRQTHVHLVPVDLTEPVAEALKLVRASTPATIEIASKLHSATVRADATQIQQIVLNLCTNAAQAIPDQRGRIEVTVQQVQISPSTAAEVPQLWKGDAIQLSVSDDGCGMDQATLQRIFDPFFTTKPAGEGTGLGLAIVQGVVAGHEGAIRVRSRRGAGSIFEIYFRPCEEQIAATHPSTIVPRGQQQEIIVVDDERSVANFAATRLQQLGYRPTVFSDPQAALLAFAAEPNRFHALVTDLTMPRLTGAELIKQIRARGWLIPAVIITGYEGEAVRANVRALPRCLVLPKPFSGDELGRALHQVMADYAVHREP